MLTLRWNILPLILSSSIFEWATAVPQWRNSTDGRQYLIEGDEKYNWFQAFRECARRNMQLVEIHSQQKNEALIKVLKPIFGNSHNLWLGAMDEYNRHKGQRPFYWFTSGKAITYSNWATANPDNDISEEHCVHLWAEMPNYQWNDHHCDTFRFGYICEEHHLRADYRKALAEKQEECSDTNGQLFTEYQKQQRQIMEKLENRLSEIEKGGTELEEHLHNSHRKLDSVINHILSIYKTEVDIEVEKRNAVIRNLNEDLKICTELITKKMSAELQEAKAVCYK